MSYRIKLDIFEGPLDLLLHLVKKNEVELSDIPVATITDQYLAYLGLLQQLDLDVAGSSVPRPRSSMRCSWNRCPCVSSSALCSICCASGQRLCLPICFPVE